MKDTRKPRTYKVLGTLEKEEYQDSHERQVFGTLAIAQKSRFSNRQSGSHLVKHIGLPKNISKKYFLGKGAMRGKSKALAERRGLAKFVALRRVFVSPNDCR